VNRRPAKNAKKQTPKKQSAKKPRTLATRTPAAARNAVAPIALDKEGAEYLGRLAEALSRLILAQDSWVNEIDLASRQPAVMQDPQWQARSRASINSMLLAAEALRLEGVPDAMRPVDDMLGRAEREAQAAFDGYAAAVQGSNVALLLEVLRHVDRMSQLIQQAYGLIRTEI